MTWILQQMFYLSLANLLWPKKNCYLHKSLMDGARVSICLSHLLWMEISMSWTAFSSLKGQGQEVIMELVNAPLSLARRVVLRMVVQGILVSLSLHENKWCSIPLAPLSACPFHVIMQETKNRMAWIKQIGPCGWEGESGFGGEMASGF